MRLTLSSLLLGLTLSSSLVNAAPAQSAPVTTCTKDTNFRPCVAKASTNTLGIPVGAAVKGICYQEQLALGSARVSDPYRSFVLGRLALEDC
jgi:hypothetical protein